MKPIETLARVQTPDGELTLWLRDGVYHLSADGLVLMTSRAHGSEEAMARLACEALPADRRAAPQVLVGGLGFGYTLRAALDRLPKAARAVVSEIFPAVLEWNRGVLAELAGRPLTDRRVRVDPRDVWDVLGDPEPFDAILLDVDNGPRAFTLRSNDRLYARPGLERLRRGLVDGGVLTVWSSAPSPRFAAELERAGFVVVVERVAAHERLKGAGHTVFVARNRRRPEPPARARSGRGRRRGPHD